MSTLQQLKDELQDAGEALTHRCNGECKGCGYYKPDNKQFADYGYCSEGFRLAELSSKIRELEKIQELDAQ